MKKPDLAGYEEFEDSYLEADYVEMDWDKFRAWCKEHPVLLSGISTKPSKTHWLLGPGEDLTL